MSNEVSRLLERDERFYYYDFYGKIKTNTNYYRNLGFVDRIYVDSNNFLHNLEGLSSFESYYIHGKRYTKKEYDIERNRILMLEELWVW